MANFTFYTTNKGLALSAKAEAGRTLNFTRCAVGSGTLGTDDDPKSFTDLITRQRYMAINSISASGPKAKIITTLSNANLTTGFYIREIGIYATDPDGGEILYAYGYASAPDYLPLTGNNVVEQQYDLYIIVSGTAEITATLGDSTVYAPAEALEDHIEDNVYDSGGVHGFETERPTDENDGQMLIWDKASGKHVYNGATPAMPSGAVNWFAMLSAPSGWLECNGAVVSRTTYSDLFSAIGTTFGSGDGSTTFNLPELRGEFIRGYDNGREVDLGRIFGSEQEDELKSHTHQIRGSGGGHNTGHYGPQCGACSANYTIGMFDGGIGETGGTETRPKNIALLACIKY